MIFINYKRKTIDITVDKPRRPSDESNCEINSKQKF